MAKTAKPQGVPAGKLTLAEDPKYSQAVQNYEAGLRALQDRKFDRARAAFQKVVEGPSRELADRARVHLASCDAQAEKAPLQFKTAEEHYDYAVCLMNQGDYVAAREHLDKLLKSSKTDYVVYGMAALECLTGHLEDALRHLEEALRLNGQLRFQARNDSDFHNLAEDPRFTELLYPDPGGEAASSGYGNEA
jgi:tetratricopeptide (TPR) repeat protein